MKQSTYALKLAGAAALAGSTQAYSQIIQIGTHELPTNLTGVSAGPGSTEYYNITTGKTTTDASMAGGYNLTFQVFNNGLLFTGVSPIQTQDGVAGFSFPYYGTTYAFASPIAPGTKIGSDTQTFLTGTGTPGGTYLQALTSFIQPADSPEYIGFQFLDSNDDLIHNGWLELNSSSSASGLIFLGGAYAATAGADINAGAVPEPGTLSSLVVGAAALGGIGLLRRRRESLVPAKN